MVLPKRISQDREVESHMAHIHGNGGSNPSPAIMEYSSVGRAMVSKTMCREFDSHCSCLS